MTSFVEFEFIKFVSEYETDDNLEEIYDVESKSLKTPFSGHINMSNVEFVSKIIKDEVLVNKIDRYGDHVSTTKRLEYFYIMLTSGNIYYCLSNQYNKFVITNE